MQLLMSRSLQDVLAALLYLQDQYMQLLQHCAKIITQGSTCMRERDSLCHCHQQQNSDATVRASSCALVFNNSESCHDMSMLLSADHSPYRGPQLQNVGVLSGACNELL